MCRYFAVEFGFLQGHALREVVPGKGLFSLTGVEEYKRRKGTVKPATAFAVLIPGCVLTTSCFDHCSCWPVLAATSDLLKQQRLDTLKL